MSVVEAKQGNFTFQLAQAANSNGNVLNNEQQQFGFLLIHIVGAGFTGVVNFEGSSDPAGAFVTLRGDNVSNGAAAVLDTNPTSVVYRFDIAGFKQIRMRTSGVSAGSVSVYGRCQSF